MDKKLRIVQIGTKYFPAHGGVEVTIKQECEFLAGRGHCVEVLTSNLQRHLTHEKINNAPNLINGVKVTRCKSFRTPYVVYPFMPTLPLRLLMKQVDIVHTHVFWYFPADAAVRVAKLKGIPILFNPHFHTRQGKEWELYIKYIGQKTLDLATVIIVVSEWEREYMERSGLKLKRVELIPSGADPEEFEEINYNIFERLGFNDSKIILHAARIAPDKGADLLLKAAPMIFKRVPEAKIFIAGHDFGYQNTLENLANELGLSDRVHFLGELPRPDLVSAFKHADVFVLPSQYEAFGLVLAEAMLGKTPVVASKTSAIPYVVQEGKTGFLFTPRDNLKEIADYIIMLLRNERLNREMGEAGYQRALERYNINKHYEQLEALYFSLL
jgi:glycosyltransferase involved in cell wall biosynthesis